MLLVVDASVVIDLVLAIQPEAGLARRRIERDAAVLAAPHLIDAEVAQGLRNNLLRGHLAQAGARTALADFLALPIERYPHPPLLPRAFEMRDNATVYDALYLTLAETLETVFLTRDTALARIPGVRATVEVIAGRG